MDESLEDMFGRWKSKPGPGTLTPLITALNPLVDKTLKSYGYDKEPNMRTTAQLHMIKSLNRYDPTKSQLKTFMTNELKRIQRLGPKHRYTIAIPEQAALDLKSIDRHEAELQHTLGRDPSTDELSDMSGLSTGRIQAVRKKYSVPVVTEDAFQSPEGGVSVPGTSPGLDPQTVWLEAVYPDLDPADKKIMDWSLGWHGQPKLSKTQMAVKLGVSVAAITQRSMRISKRLEEGAGYRPI